MGWKQRRRQAAELADVHAETARMQVETLRSELGDLHREVARRDVELLSVLSRLATVNDRLSARLEVEQHDRQHLVRSIDRLAMFIAAPSLPAPTHPASPTATPPAAATGAGTIIGGSVDPSRTPELVDLTEHHASDHFADLPADLPVAPVTRDERPLACEVHLQFGDRWITGFQIEETIRTDAGTQFRLRRQVDGWVLPELFDESEVRVFMQPVVDVG